MHVIEKFERGEQISVAAARLSWKSAVMVAATEGVLVLSGEIISPEFDEFFAEKIFPVIWNSNPELARNFAVFVENMATNPEYMMKTAEVALGLIVFAGISIIAAQGMNYYQEMLEERN